MDLGAEISQHDYTSGSAVFTIALAIGSLIIAVFLVIVGGMEALEGGEVGGTILIIVIGGGFLAAAVFGMRMARESLADRSAFTLFENGIRIQGKRGVRVWTWRDMNAVTIQETTRGGVSSLIELTFRNEDEAFQLTKMTHTGVTEATADEVRRRSAEVLVPRYERHMESGKCADFGGVRIWSDRIEIEGDTLSYDQVRCWYIQRAMLAVVGADGRTRGAGLHGVPNGHVATRLIAARFPHRDEVDD